MKTLTVDEIEGEALVGAIITEISELRPKMKALAERCADVYTGPMGAKLRKEFDDLKFKIDTLELVKRRIMNTPTERPKEKDV